MGLQEYYCLSRDRVKEVWDLIEFAPPDHHRLWYAFGNSILIHAAILSYFSVTAIKPPELPPEIVEIEYVESQNSRIDAQGDAEQSSMPQQPVNPLPLPVAAIEEKTPPTLRRKAERQSPLQPSTASSEKVALSSSEAPSSPPEIPAPATATSPAEHAEETPSGCILCMRDKSALLPRGDGLSPQVRDLEETLRVAEKPVIVEANAKGSYLRYADGSTTVRSPDLGHFPIPEKTPINDVSVHEDGYISGLGDRIPKHIDMEKFARYASLSPQECDLYSGDNRHYEDKEEYRTIDALNIIIDSSGSMGVNFYTAPATTCAYKAALSTLRNNARVAVFNFSDDTYVVTETRNIEKIALGIAISQKGGTFLPESDLENLIHDGGRKDIAIITDTQIKNYEQALPYFKKAIDRNPENKGYLIVIGDPKIANEEVVKGFQSIGFTVLYYG